MHGRGQMMNPEYFNDFGRDMGNFHYMGMIGEAVFIVAIIVIAVLLYKSYTKNKRVNSPAMELLKEKLVSGEITEAEFVSKKKLLAGK